MDQSSLGSVQDNVIDLFRGRFMINPGQFPLLDNSIIEISKDKFTMVFDTAKNIIFDFDIKNTITQRCEDKLSSIVELKIEKVKKFNTEDNETINEIITKLLKFKPPFSIYISYNKMGSFTVSHGYPYHHPLFIMNKMRN
tara:strand:+ start:45 stop:464 length:420 start_codon:yes stop_codon:yes gene_type:complete